VGSYVIKAGVRPRDVNSLATSTPGQAQRLAPYFLYLNHPLNCPKKLIVRVIVLFDFFLCAFQEVQQQSQDTKKQKAPENYIQEKPDNAPDNKIEKPSKKQ